MPEDETNKPETSGRLESSFRTAVVIPLLRRMGYIDVADTQGASEFGKDVVFAEYDRFGTKRWYAAQLKAGDVSGVVDGRVNELVAQVRTAFDVPFPDLVSKEDVYVSEVFVMISGRFTNNAKTILLERLKDRRTWVRFLDAEGIALLQTIHFRDLAEVFACLISELTMNLKLVPVMLECAQAKSGYPYSHYLSSGPLKPQGGTPSLRGV